MLSADAGRSRIISYLRMIKVSHSVFALPFALTAAVIAARGLPSFRQGFFIILAMVGARSAAMGFNRIVDRDIDAKNPRTMNREIPSGVIRVRDAWVFSAVSFGIMMFAAYMLNPLCFRLSPIAVAVLVAYSYTKRVTSLSHVVLGIAVAGAPLGAWIAVTGSIDAEIVPLVIAVVAWLAGFDVLYALQDAEFDRRHGLFSIPARFGVGVSLLLARAFHAVTWVLLVANGIMFHLGVLYYVGVLVVGVLLLYEHALVKEDDLSRLTMAFFTMNGYISLTVFFFTLLDLLI